MHRTVILVVTAVALVGCGGPSESDVQATVAAAVQATRQADTIAAGVKATQEAEQACAALALGTYAGLVEGEITAFEQQAQLVGATPRVGLGTPLQRLLDIQTETRKLDTPDCVADFHARVLHMMQAHQDAYQNFAAQGGDALTNAILKQATDELAGVRRDLATLKSGQVPPTLTPGPATPIVTPGEGVAKP